MRPSVTVLILPLTLAALPAVRSQGMFGGILNSGIGVLTGKTKAPSPTPSPATVQPKAGPIFSVPTIPVPRIPIPTLPPVLSLPTGLPKLPTILRPIEIPTIIPLPPTGIPDLSDILPTPIANFIKFILEMMEAFMKIVDVVFGLF